MTLSLWCVLAATALPYVWTMAAKSNPDYLKSGNQAPREYLENLADPKRKRAHWAQLNAFEALPGFAAAVLIAHLTHADQNLVNGLSVAWVVFRLLHGVMYMADKAMLRSLVWFGGVGCVIGLYVAAAMGKGLGG